MKKIMVILGGFFLWGCDSFPTATYSLGSFASYKAGGEIINLCQQMEILAENNALVNRQPSRDGTQCYFSESESNSVVLGVRELKEHLVIDVQVFNNNKAFKQINSEVIEFLSNHYSGQYIEVLGR